MNAAINTINLTSIIMTAGTQFRASMLEDNVIDLMDLIERGVQFKTPIRLAKCNDTLYLTDGFHRIEAYGRLRMMEIPADQCVITDVATIEEVRVLAAGANVQHGKGNSNADYHNIIKKLMEFGDTYMKNAFEPDISKIAQALGAAQPAVGRGYNNYPKDDYEARLSTICKAKRDAAILEKHKDGMSNNAIAKLFGMTRQTVDNWVRDHAKNPESGKFATPESSSSTSTVPMASTLDRAATREDADAYIASQLSSLEPIYMEEDELSLTMDEGDEPPFDVLDALAAWGPEQSTHNTKSNTVESPEEVTAEMLEKELEDTLNALSQARAVIAQAQAAEAKALAQVQRIRQEAGIHGITLSK